MKKAIIAIIVLLIIIGLVVFFVTRNQKQEEPATVEPSVEQTEVVDVPKEEQIGTAGSNMPLKDRYDDAEYEIKVAFQYWLAEAYGDKVNDARIYVNKIYTAEDEQAIDVLKEMNLGPDEIAFEVNYELHPAEGADINELTVASGVLDEESGWITEKANLGILRPNPDTTSEQKYIVTDIGTGW